MIMTTSKQALRGQSVDANFYLAECCNCGQVMPSSKLIESRNYPDGDADCYCPHCNADDCDINDMGSSASEAWNYQQKRIEALLDDLDGKDGRINELDSQRALAFMACNRWRDKCVDAEAKLEAAEKRIAELEAREVVPVYTALTTSERAELENYRNAQQVVPSDGRDQFEEWFKFHHGDEHSIAMLQRANGGANYIDPYVDLAWISWKDSRAAMLQGGKS